ncbi:MAG: mechanosensitive ion channel, partial [Saprospiraceae bacterium]|nr:mechanosensitive ion channel [Saprospiraceae bacterium]
LLGAFLLLVAGWLIARTLSKVVKRLLVAVKADRLTDKLKEIEVVQRSGLELSASSFLSKTIYYALWLIFIIAASDSLGMSIVSKQIADILNYMPRFIAASIVFVVGIIVANFVKNAVSTAFKSLNIPSGKLISSFIFYFLLLTLSITALEQAGMDTDFLTENIQIILGGIVIAFAVGFGLSSRTMLQNILASSYAKKKFQLGDEIKVDEYQGTIIQLDNVSVTLFVEEGARRVVIPQHQIMNTKVEIIRQNS